MNRPPRILIQRAAFGDTDAVRAKPQASPIRKAPAEIQPRSILYPPKIWKRARTKLTAAISMRISEVKLFNNDMINGGFLRADHRGPVCSLFCSYCRPYYTHKSFFSRCGVRLRLGSLHVFRGSGSI